jgi:hypothetical protein
VNSGAVSSREMASGDAGTEIAFEAGCDRRAKPLIHLGWFYAAFFHLPFSPI